MSSVVFSSVNARLVTGSWDKTVKVWDTQTGALVCEHIEHRGVFAFSPDGRLVVSGSNDWAIRIFELATERVVRVLDLPGGWILHVMFAADNIHLATLDAAHWVYVWDVTTGARICEFSLKDDGWTRSPIFSPDGTGILVDGDNGEPRASGEGTQAVLAPAGMAHSSALGRHDVLCGRDPAFL